jgi:hypothetical protein
MSENSENNETSENAKQTKTDILTETFECLYCGDDFTLTEEDLKTVKDTDYCSEQCREDAIADSEPDNDIPDSDDFDDFDDFEEGEEGEEGEDDDDDLV